MAMFLIAGSFRITGAKPDGDSIRFTPNEPAKWDLITGPNRVKRNASGAAQLRLDAIDALETHYGSPRTHQPLDFAHAAAAELLDWLGFSNVVRGQDETVTSSSPDMVAGFIRPARPTSTGAASPSSGTAPHRRTTDRRSSSTSTHYEQRPTITSSSKGLPTRPTIGRCSPICGTSSPRWPSKPATPD